MRECTKCNAPVADFQATRSNDLYKVEMCSKCESEYAKSYWTPERKYKHMYDSLVEQKYNVSMYRKPAEIVDNAPEDVYNDLF